MSLRNPERGLLSVKGLIFGLGLIASFIFVGAIYGILIRPGANKADLANSFGVDVGSSFSSFFVILKDYEQQMCLSLFLWGVMILIYKFVLSQKRGQDPWPLRSRERRYRRRPRSRATRRKSLHLAPASRPTFG